MPTTQLRRTRWISKQIEAVYALVKKGSGLLAALAGFPNRLRRESIRCEESDKGLPHSLDFQTD